MACVNIYDPHPPFNPPQRYRDLFDPADMPGPLFRQSDIEQQEKLAESTFDHPSVRPMHWTYEIRFSPNGGALPMGACYRRPTVL